jgi:hypothetical protein
LSFRDFVYLTKLFQTLKDKQDVFPLFEVHSLEKQKFFGLVTDLVVDDVSSKSVKLKLEFLIFRLQDFLSFLFVFGYFSKDYFLVLVFYYSAVSSFIDFG